MEFTQGNMVVADNEALVNTVNCVGVMGKGIALQFKQAFPANNREYEKACAKGQVRLGHLFIYATGQLANPKYIVNFPTKRHWRAKSRLEDIESGLYALKHEITERGIKSIAIPPLGCGHGGLNWNEVRPLIENILTDLADVQIMVFEPKGTPDANKMPIATSDPIFTRARAMLVKLMEVYSIAEYKLSLLEIQKLAYFLQVAGEPLKLNIMKQKYGPYAENLNFVLQRIEGHLIRGYGDRSSRAMITLTPDAGIKASKFLENKPESTRRINRVAQLIQGYETPYGMELLASVHWVAINEGASTIDAIIDKIFSWNVRKKQTFREEHIRKAGNRLHDQQWIKLTEEGSLD